MPPKRKAAEAEPSYFSRRNWQWLGAGAVVIIAGFIALSQGSITLAPILLVLGYCVLIPMGILAGPKRTSEQGPSGDSAPN
jgi:uncharacterized membrane protein HdeD (DUF308 family)